MGEMHHGSRSAEWFQVLKIWHFSKPILQNDQINPSNSPQNPTKRRHSHTMSYIIHQKSPNPINLVSKYLPNQSYLRIKVSPSPLTSPSAWIWCEGPHRSVVRYVGLGLRAYTDQLRLCVDDATHNMIDYKMIRIISVNWYCMILVLSVYWLVSEIIDSIMIGHNW